MGGRSRPGVRGQNTPMGLCDQNSGIGGYDICYELALQRAAMIFVVEVFSCEASEEEKQTPWPVVL